LFQNDENIIEVTYKTEWKYDNEIEKNVLALQMCSSCWKWAIWKIQNLIEYYQTGNLKNFVESHIELFKYKIKNWFYK
jgi:hypothetical protein